MSQREFPGPEDRVVVDVPGWRKIKPRIPDTPQRRQLERQRNVREVVFGAKDGILTTMGIVTGLGAASGRGVVIVSGLLALLAGSLSMAVGEFQGAKSERDVVQASIDMEREEMAANPQDEFAEQVAYYKLKGFSADEAHMIVSRLAKNPEIYLYEMMRDEFGIDPRVAEASSVLPAVFMGVSYAVGSLVPIVPYLLPFAMRSALIASFVFGLVGLFAIGYYAGTLGGRHPWRRGLEVALYGSVVFALTFLAGHFIPPLFHMNAITTGG
ncbi:MAG: VIT1/CCC1 transporter family protein [Candidatus Eremiobacteraeota bacterium]|nr:VIT1/CCC1 transporter family protein [Candidatus Eremiobacteraeota bacterium]